LSRHQPMSQARVEQQQTDAEDDAEVGEHVEEEEEEVETNKNGLEAFKILADGSRVAFTKINSKKTGRDTELCYGCSSVSLYVTKDSRTCLTKYIVTCLDCPACASYMKKNPLDNGRNMGYCTCPSRTDCTGGCSGAKIPITWTVVRLCTAARCLYVQFFSFIFIRVVRTCKINCVTSKSYKTTEAIKAKYAKMVQDANSKATVTRQVFDLGVPPRAASILTSASPALINSIGASSLSVMSPSATPIVHSSIVVFS